MKPPSSPFVRILLGVGTFLPLAGIACLAYFELGPPAREFLQGTESSGFWFNLTWSLLFFGGLIGLAHALYYLLIVFGSDAGDSDRNFWLTTLVFFFPLAGPLFWYRVIWKRMPVADATKKA